MVLIKTADSEFWFVHFDSLGPAQNPQHVAAAHRVMDLLKLLHKIVHPGQCSCGEGFGP